MSNSLFALLVTFFEEDTERERGKKLNEPQKGGNQNGKSLQWQRAKHDSRFKRGNRDDVLEGLWW